MKIAICGPAAAGKGTIARRYAIVAGIGYVDLGLLFRLGAFALSTGRIGHLDELIAFIKNKDVEYAWAEGIATIYWEGEDITSPLLSQEVAQQTSILASDRGQQEVLTEIANYILTTFSSVICDGRNAGSTILPDANYKFYVTASLKERTCRRHLDILERGGTATYADVQREIVERDQRDTERVAHPLIIPSGAIILETDFRSIEDSVRFILEKTINKS